MIAAAITDKGIQTAADAAFATMVNNITAIETHTKPVKVVTWTDYGYNSVLSSTYTVPAGYYNLIIFLSTEAEAHTDNNRVMYRIKHNGTVLTNYDINLSGKTFQHWSGVRSVNNGDKIVFERMRGYYLEKDPYITVHIYAL